MTCPSHPIRASLAQASSPWPPFPKRHTRKCLMQSWLHDQTTSATPDSERPAKNRQTRTTHHLSIRKGAKAHAAVKGGAWGPCDELPSPPAVTCYMRGDFFASVLARRHHVRAGNPRNSCSHTGALSAPALTTLPCFAARLKLERC